MGTLNPGLVEIELEQLRKRRSSKWRRYPSDVIPAWLAEMDFPLAEPIAEGLGEAVRLHDCGYASPEQLGLAEAFAEFAESRLGWKLDPAEVRPCSDVVSAIAATLAVIASPGDQVVVNTPVYRPFFEVIADIGCTVVEAPLADGRLDPDAVERCFEQGAVALILCSPHNPTGDVPARAELAAIADAAERHGAWVLADEIHAPLTMPGVQHVPYLTVSDSAAEWAVSFCSASKAFNIAGLRCAQIATASRNAAELVGRLPSRATHCGHLGAIATIAAFREGKPWLDDVIAVLDHNRKLLSELLEAHLPEVGYIPPRAGYLAWLDLRPLQLGPDPSVALLKRGGVALSPGPQFGGQGNGFARLNFGTSPALLEQIVEQMAKATS